uniref:Acyl-CoA dehydrogenase n=1 Tax=uncultured bacterium AZ_40 TaxID=1630016 RepID=A0A0E3GLW8_9BACT|nr:acyl-CoA dehydrogenase [uncultured bacterium AZ_40]
MTQGRLRTGTSDEELLRDADVPSFVAGLHAGRVRWDLIHPFPEQDPEDRLIGDRAVAEMTGLLRERIDPITAEADRRLPDGLVDVLRTSGLLKLGAPRELGGHDLSPYNVFRTLCAALSWSAAVGQTLSVDNSVGVGAYLPALPAGPLRDWVRERVAASVVSCTADTEPIGAHNKERRTVAVPTGDGSAYLLTGEKIFVANAPIADVIVTTATLGDQLRLFFVDAHDPGVQVKARHDFVGLAGFPNGNLRYDAVRVPRERMLPEERHDGRLTPTTTRMVVRGRMYLVVAPSLAFARLAVHCARDFARRRSIDGRPLAGYDEVQRQVAESLADTFAIAALAEWCLLAERSRPANPLYEQLAAKNIASVACGRVVDRTMSLFGAEGLETAASKARRGAVPLPVERVYRDARVMRINGGVDFQLDNWAGQYLLASHYSPPDGAAAAPVDLASLPGVRLSARNLAHADRVVTDAARLAQTCRDLVRRYPDSAALFERERVVILLSLVLNELLAMALVLARAASLDAAAGLADVYCTAAADRLDDWWRRLAAADETSGADHAAVTDHWLHGDALEFLTADLVPPVAR